LATVTLIATAFSTANAASYAYSPCTPATGAVLVSIAHVSGTDDTVTDVLATTGNPYQWTRLQREMFFVNANCCYVHVTTTNLISSAVTFTFSCSGNNGTGATLALFQVTGANLFIPVQQSKTVSGNTVNPAITLNRALNTNNAVIGVLGRAGAASSFTQPAGWTTASSGSYATPANSMAAAFRNSGDTSSTITFTSLGAIANVLAVIEINDAAQDGQFRGFSNSYFGV
jgi:hypothetical protein